MIREVLDPHSGAILFKKDSESLLIEKLARQIEELEAKVVYLEEKLQSLESKIYEKDS